MKKQTKNKIRDGHSSICHTIIFKLYRCFKCIIWGLPVPSIPCKEIESQHFILTTSKKLKRLKNQQLFWDQNIGEETGKTNAPKVGEIDRQIQEDLTYLRRDSPAETSLEIRARTEKPEP